jgi:exonuclease V
VVFSSVCKSIVAGSDRDHLTTLIMSEGSDYDIYDAEFALSLEDFARIDAAVSASYAAAATTGGPSLTIELERPANEPLLFEDPTSKAAVPPKGLSKRNERKSRTPYEQFRAWKKGFSVTDLIGPAW